MDMQMMEMIDMVEYTNLKRMSKSFIDSIRVCRKCGHTWVARISDVRQCPKCHTHRWDI